MNMGGGEGRGEKGKGGRVEVWWEDSQTELRDTGRMDSQKRFFSERVHHELYACF